MKNLLTILFVVSIILGASANEIPNIPDANYIGMEYPIRDGAIIMILQPVPDDSGDFTMTLCNKHSRCRQTSMSKNEIRYIGLFLEDMNYVLIKELGKKLTVEEYFKEQDDFRKLYANYMNVYDGIFGGLETPIKVEHQ